MEIQPHEELCNFIADTKKSKRLILMPRGSFKSSVCTVGYSLWRLVNDPNLRILISSETLAQSKVFLNGIKNHIEDNKLFKSLFGDLRPAKVDVTWKKDEITLGSRTKPIREPSVTASGVGVAKVGMHYDLIILDDVVSDKNVNTPDQIEKTLAHYKLLLSILDPGAELILIGTRYSYADLYGHILSEEAEIFSIMKKSAVMPDGSLFFPSRLTKEYLDQQKKAQGNYIFSCQYQNEPVDEDSAMFKTAWLKFYKHAPAALRNFIVVDPAASIESQADFSGVIICGIDPDNNILVREALELKVSIYDLIRVIFDKIAQYNIHDEGCLGLETIAFQKTIKYMLIEEMNKRNFFFAIHELAANSRKSKMMRIRGLQPYFENGKIFLQKDQHALIDQIIRYPRTKHDDMIDALANVLEVMVPADPIKGDKWEHCKLSSNEKWVWQNADEAITKHQKRMVKMKRGRI
jgi:predicted phage terminase large subunit-like protein